MHTPVHSLIIWQTSWKGFTKQHLGQSPTPSTKICRTRHLHVIHYHGKYPTNSVSVSHHYHSKSPLNFSSTSTNTIFKVLQTAPLPLAPTHGTFHQNTAVHTSILPASMRLPALLAPPVAWDECLAPLDESLIKPKRTGNKKASSIPSVTCPKRTSNKFQ